MFIDEKTLFAQAAAERQAEKDYEMSCARTFSFEYEIPSLNVRRTANIVSYNEEQAHALLRSQMPREWLKVGYNVTGFESRQRIDLIHPQVFEHYKKLIEAAKPTSAKKR
jgi:hypothetical protein